MSYIEGSTIPRSFGTHDGTFHADEVTACALLQLFNLIDADKVYRTRDLKELAKCEYVCDVGGVYDPKVKRFDHHQVTYRGDLSSAGMILLHLKTENILNQKEFDFFNNSLVRGVDAHDNGKAQQISGLCSFSHIVSNFTPINYECNKKEQDEAFSLAVQFVFQHLDRLWKRYIYTQSCKKLVENAMAMHKNCLIFDHAIPWMDVFFEMDGGKHPAQFVIMPSGKHWKLRGIPPDQDHKMQVRHPLPDSWAGLLQNDLQKITGISGAVFCHKGRFISVWKTKEDALLALKKILKN